MLGLAEMKGWGSGVTLILNTKILQLHFRIQTGNLRDKTTDDKLGHFFCLFYFKGRYVMTENKQKNYQ